MNMIPKGPDLIFKDIVIRDKELTALVDTGFDMLFVLGEINFVPEKVKLFGIGDPTIITLGRFDEIVHVDGLDIQVTFYVVGKRDVNHSVMLGNSLIRKVDVTISNGEL